MENKCQQLIENYNKLISMKSDVVFDKVDRKSIKELLEKVKDSSVIIKILEKIINPLYPLKDISDFKLATSVSVKNGLYLDANDVFSLSDGDIENLVSHIGKAKCKFINFEILLSQNIDVVKKVIKLYKEKINPDMLFNINVNIQAFKGDIDSFFDFLNFIKDEDIFGINIFNIKTLINCDEIDLFTDMFDLLKKSKLKKLKLDDFFDEADNGTNKKVLLDLLCEYMKQSNLISFGMSASTFMLNTDPMSDFIRFGDLSRKLATAISESNLLDVNIDKKILNPDLLIKSLISKKNNKIKSLYIKSLFATDIDDLKKLLENKNLKYLEIDGLDFVDVQFIEILKNSNIKKIFLNSNFSIFQEVREKFEKYFDLVFINENVSFKK